MSYWQLYRQELQAILADKAILVTLFGGIVFYAFMYPLPYLHEVATEQAVVVVDNDSSSASRQIIRHADASPKVEIVGQAASLSEAEQWIADGRAHGVMVIPEGFRRNLLLAHGSTLAYGGDANFFLVYSAIAEGLITVDLDSAKRLQVLGMLARGENPKKAELTVNAIKLNSVPAFNPSLGYMSYIVPAVMVLVLHQTLLIGSGILGAGQWRHAGYWQTQKPLTLVLSRVMAFFTLYLIFASFYLGYCHYHYRLTVQGHLHEVMLMMLPFLLASSAFGIAVSCLYLRRDMPTQIVLLISMPILFASGLIWPLELIPQAIVWLSQLIPATPGIVGMVKLNQMAAPWHSVFYEWLQLWLLFGVYLLIAVKGVSYRQKQFS
ncbi:ABC transporter permease [Paraferrimonas haliotis]|uniref:ABC transporter n=1 Tax=Paraferrimonas haliotis TaxID=2013866 RepID=A0AA37TLC4_9GAMM|nr:ABC transporter permease [Paraferrimonas haliotis]GLS83707.1 ABC transporter [Paraferrimonas haliotis]